MLTRSSKLRVNELKPSLQPKKVLASKEAKHEMAAGAVVSPELSESLPADLERLRAMIVSDLKGAIDAALAPLKDSVNRLTATAKDHGERINSLDEAMTLYSNRVVSLEKECKDLRENNKTLFDSLDNLENRSRRCNLKIFNIPEKAEGNDAVKFMSEFLSGLLGEVFPTAPMLDRAHRLGALKKPGSDGNVRPRPMIIKFHYYQDKDRAVRCNRSKLVYRGQRVFFQQDYSAVVNKKRAKFNPVKALLYEKKVKFGLLFPAVLRVDYDGKTHNFGTAEDAQKFYDDNIGM